MFITKDVQLEVSFVVGVFFFMSSTRPFLQLAQRLQKRPTIPKKSIDFGPLPPASFKGLSQVVHIPTKYENLFEETLPEYKKEKNLKKKVIVQRTTNSEFTVKKLEPKLPRHKSQEEMIPSLKYQGKKIARVESTLREVLESRQLVKALQVDKWMITSLTLSTNEKIMFVWWRLDQCVADPEIHTVFFV